MHASDNVVLTSNNGSKASAEHLSADTVQGKLSYRLTGSPNATVTDDKTTIVGPVIRFTPDDNLAEIIGVGSMNGVDPKDPKQTINIAWTGGATINGTTDWVDVDKDVVMTARQADGTINGATARHLRAKLEPRPPSTNPASRPSTQVEEGACRAADLP